MQYDKFKEFIENLTFGLNVNFDYQVENNQLRIVFSKIPLNLSEIKEISQEYLNQNTLDLRSINLSMPDEKKMVADLYKTLQHIDNNIVGYWDTKNKHIQIYFCDENALSSLQQTISEFMLTTDFIESVYLKR